MMKQQLIAMPKYEAYKDSGVEWIGEIPEHWEVNSVKAIFQERKENNDPIKTKDILSLCMYRGVIPYAEKGASGNKAKEDITAYRLAYPGDIVMNSMNVVAGSVGLSKYFGAVSPVYYMLRPRKKQDVVEYFTAIFRNEAFQKSLVGLGNGILVKQSESTGKLNTIRMRIPMSKMNMVEMPYPSPDEQTAIAKFLDRKTTQIDQAIVIKEKQIELLQERKKILIQNAVTRGLDPTVPMKDSGVEWIGEVPAHWEVKPGMIFFSENKKANKGMIEDKVLSLSYGKIIVKPVEKLTGLVPESFETYQIVDPGDIIVRCMDLQNDKTSFRTGIARDRGIITSAYLSLKITGKSNPDYIHFYLHVLDITKAIYKFGSGLRQNLSYLDFRRLPVLDVPIDEQLAIVEFIKNSHTKVDNAIELQQQQIEKLKEYKSTLINSAVTGKIKVV